MPYIKKDRRKLYKEVLDALEKIKLHKIEHQIEVGDLNFLLTSVCLAYIENQGVKYQTYNDITGAIENCKMEIYRRLTSKYEDKKIEQNGDL